VAVVVVNNKPVPAVHTMGWGPAAQREAPPGVPAVMVFSPATGAITPLKALTMRLVETYHTVNPSRQEQQVLRRVLTQPSKPAANGCVVVSPNPCSTYSPLSFSRGILQRL